MTQTRNITDMMKLYNQTTVYKAIEEYLLYLPTLKATSLYTSSCRTLPCTACSPLCSDSVMRICTSFQKCERRYSLKPSHVFPYPRSLITSSSSTLQPVAQTTDKASAHPLDQGLWSNRAVSSTIHRHLADYRQYHPDCFLYLPQSP